MKKNLLTAILVSAALLFSSMALTGCAQSVEDDSSPFEGSWVNNSNYEGFFTETLTFSGDSCTEAGAFLGVAYSYTGTFTYDESAKTLTMTYSSSETEPVTYAISGSTLTLTDSEGDSSTYTKE